MGAQIGLRELGEAGIAQELLESWVICSQRVDQSQLICVRVDTQTSLPWYFLRLCDGGLDRGVTFQQVTRERALQLSEIHDRSARRLQAFLFSACAFAHSAFGSVT